MNSQDLQRTSPEIGPEKSGSVYPVYDVDPFPLLEWYDREHRDLPWRRDPSPYHVWVSEIMLQQTRVETVRGYYERFMKRLPDLRTFAESDEDTCLKLWEGLGYYSRVRNMHRAAQLICQQYDGFFPAEHEAIVRLPGVGSYTAGAVESICFGQKTPALDGNLLRIFSRLCCFERNIRSSEAREGALRFYRAMMEKLPEKNDTICPGIPGANPPGDFNQALMDLGSAVCVPRTSPHCAVCPFEKVCLAHHRESYAGREYALPVLPPRKERRTEQLTVFVIRKGETFVIRKRPERGLLAGMYELPNAEGMLDEAQARQYIEKLGFRILRIRALDPHRHVFSHIEWEMTAYEIRTDELYPAKADDGCIFVMEDDAVQRYSIPTAFAFYASIAENGL